MFCHFSLDEYGSGLFAGLTDFRAVACWFFFCLFVWSLFLLFETVSQM
jgi:hypothetical protein